MRNNRIQFQKEEKAEETPSIRNFQSLNTELPFPRFKTSQPLELQLCKQMMLTPNQTGISKTFSGFYDHLIWKLKDQNKYLEFVKNKREANLNKIDKLYLQHQSQFYIRNKHEFVTKEDLNKIIKREEQIFLANNKSTS